MRQVARALAVWVCTLAAAPAFAQSSHRFLVIPFDNPAKEARVYWLSEAATILLADDLHALGRRAFTREERLVAFDQLQVPATAALSHATVIRLGRIIGATHVVKGSYRLSGSQLTVRAETIALDTGKMDPEVVESGPLEDLFALFERVGRRVGGGSAAAMASTGRPALPVFESYVKGLMAAATPSKVSYLDLAIKLDPSFDRARLALWAVHHEDANWQLALVAAAAIPETSMVYRRARFAVALSLIQLKRLEDAFATLRALIDRSPAATLMNNLGVVQLRRAATPDTDRASSYFSQAIKLDQDDPDYYFNLGYAHWVEKDPKTAIFWLREAVRRNPADGEAHAVLSATLQATGAAAEATRERELAIQLSPAFAEWARKPQGGELIPRNLERIKSTLEPALLMRADSAIATSSQREQQELAAFHLGRGRRLFEQGHNTDAMTELRRAVYLSPYEAEAHLLMGRIHLAGGETTAAIHALKIALWSRDSAEGRIALAAAYLQLKDHPAARASLERALEIDPESTQAREMLAGLGR